ncbi:uncharacterized protein LOC121596284 [Anopheles merus]|uniref:uncharacterized protein LOC121596284 n=1 Tax=Anopheles merus TaxID=30066 RepID=UPI001BE45A72|nr:uncharacterized protein LOC121596284 [Anopheles merus]
MYYETQTEIQNCQTAFRKLFVTERRQSQIVCCCVVSVRVVAFAFTTKCKYFISEIIKFYHFKQKYVYRHIHTNGDMLEILVTCCCFGVRSCWYFLPLLLFDGSRKMKGSRTRFAFNSIGFQQLLQNNKDARTTRMQYQKMVDKLEDVPDIARGMFKGDQTAFWEEMAEHLNALGPPIRTGATWKRCCAKTKSCYSS